MQATLPCAALFIYAFITHSKDISYIRRYDKYWTLEYCAGNPSMCCSIHLCIPQLHTFLISQSILFLPSNPSLRLERQISMKLVSYWEIFENEIGETLKNFSEWNWWDIEKSWPPPPQSPSYELIRGSLYKVCISCQITLPLWRAFLWYDVYSIRYKVYSIQCKV